MGLRRWVWLGLVLGAAASAVVAAAVGGGSRSARSAHPRNGQPLRTPGRDGDATVLHSGWRIRPAGRHLRLGDMLLGAERSPDGRILAAASCGYNAHALNLIDIASERVIAEVPLNRAWNGVAWSADGARVYVAGGVENPQRDVHVVELVGDQWRPTRGFRLEGADRARTAVAGLALSADGRRLFVLNNSDDHLYVLDAESGATRGRVEVGDHPIACRLLPGERRLFVANLGSGTLSVLDVGPEIPRVIARVDTGAHPTDIAVSLSGLVYVACARDDSVQIIDGRTLQTLEAVKTSLTPSAPAGSTPAALALSPDGATLYVACADSNAVCVVDVGRPGRSRVKGFIPAAWYPSAVAVSADGRRLFIGAGKGMGTQPNVTSLPISREYASGFVHLGRQLQGILSVLATPDDEALREHTRVVYDCTPYRDSLLRSAFRGRSVIPSWPGGPTPIKHVLYIIKENRTYDQVFGDIEKGNGDPRLTLFGREVTPNHHALAEEFVLLDNLYCSGEVSADGHPWSTMALASNFTQRSWLLSYSGKGRPDLTEQVTGARAGYIWEECARKGVSFRSYGEYAEHSTLRGHVNLEYVGKAGPNIPPPGRDTARAEIFIREFQKFEREGTMPRFMIMSLGEDHTSGTRPGAFTPKAQVGSNDQALGMIVEAVSRSSLWKEFAIFVIEDDAQNGPDHVDSHRTVGLVISPYTKRRHLDSTLYTTCSMLRTMELILGLDPLTQYDAAATPMHACFTDQPDLRPFKRLPPQIDLNARNPATAYGARESARMDWSEYDRIDEQALNRILWHSIKGRHVPLPAPVRRAIPMGGGRLASSGHVDH